MTSSTFHRFRAATVAAGIELQPTEIRRRWGTLLLLSRVLAVGGALFAFLAISAHAADEPKIVRAGATVDLLTSDKPITNATATKGNVTVVESSAPTKTYTLRYEAPTPAPDTPVSVSYSDGTATHTIHIVVTSGSQPPLSDAIYAQSFKVLFVLFVLAVILESGLAVIFNWRPFIDYFDSRGVKTVVSIAFALFFVIVFKLDVATQLVNAYSSTNYQVNLPGQVVTALVLAGGSAGVNNLLVALGFRSVRTAEETTPKPPPTKAWVAVRLLRNAARGPVNVLIEQPGNPPQVAGTILGSSKGSSGLRYFVRDPGRFPSAGGHALAAGQAYQIQLQGQDQTGAVINSAVWGPHVLAAGAIIDLDLTL